MCNTIKSRFIKEREASALLSSLGIKTSLSKIFLEDFLLFSRCKINEIVNKFFLVEYEFMPEMYLRQPGFTYSANRPFTKNKKRIKRFKESGDWIYIYQNEVDKAFFQHDMTYRRFKELPRRTASDKVLHNKAFNVAKIWDMMVSKRSCFSGLYLFLIKSLLLRMQINLQVMLLHVHGQRPWLLKTNLILKIKLFQTSN